MKRKKPVTAQELLEQLHADPEWVAGQQRVDLRMEFSKAMLARDERGLIRDLADAGVSIGSVWDLVDDAAPCPEAYPVLIAHLSVPHHRRIREGIIRALISPDAEVAVEPLIREIGRESEFDMRWLIAHALTEIARRRHVPALTRLCDDSGLADVHEQLQKATKRAYGRK